MGPGSAEYAGGLYHHRGGGARLEPADPHSGRVLQDARPRHLDMEVSVRARPGTATAAPSSTHAAGCSRVNVDQRVDLHPRPAKGRIAPKNGSIAKAGGVELS